MRDLADLLWLTQAHSEFFKANPEIVRSAQAQLAVTLEFELQRVKEVTAGGGASARAAYTDFRNFAFVTYRAAWSLQVRFS